MNIISLIVIAALQIERAGPANNLTVELPTFQSCDLMPMSESTHEQAAASKKTQKDVAELSQWGSYTIERN